MKVEFEISDEEIQKRVLVSVRDYVLESAMLKNMVRQAVYQLTADATKKVLDEHPEKLATLVMAELQDVLAETRYS